MVGRGLVSLLGAAIVLGISAPAALSDDSQRLVMVEHSPFMIEQLEKQGYDVGFVGEKYEAAVYVDDAEEAKLRADGYKIGETVEDDNTWLARKAEIAATTEREALGERARAARASRTGGVRNGKQIVTVPGEVVIMRAYTFTNYAGPLPLRRGAQQGPHQQQQPEGDDAVVLRWRRRVPARDHDEQQHHPAPTAQRRRRTATRLTDAGQYMYHRILRPLWAPTRT